MRRGPLAIALLLLITGSMAAPLSVESAERSLVSVDNPSPGLLKELLARNIMVVRDLGSYLLLVTETEELGFLEDIGVQWEMLDGGTTGKSYYTIAAQEGLSRENLAAGGARVLRFDGVEAVVEAPAPVAEGFAERGAHIARVFMRTVRLPRERTFETARKSAVADPLIQTMVDAVSEPVFTSYVQRLEDFDTRYCRHDSCQAAADWIHSQFTSFGIDSVYFQYFDSSIKDNVVAIIPGVKDPTKIVVIGGHYDSITGNHDYCPGADDDATGTACVIECARILSQYQFDYTLAFVAFGGEEVGLVGSNAFAQLAAAGGDDIVAAICVDMIGYVAGGDALDLDIISNGSSVWLRDMAMQAGSDYTPGFSVVNGSIPGGASSDHASFWASGYDAILFFEDSGSYSPYIHSGNDVVGISYNSTELAEKSVRTAVGMLATLAEPFDVAIEHSPLAHTTDTENPYRVAADITASGALNPDSILVRYRTGAMIHTLSMLPTGNGDEYEAFIPAQPAGIFINYHIVAEDADGDRLTSPGDAPVGSHTFFVGAITTVFTDQFEVESGWTVGDVGDDATEGIWERAIPNGTWFGPTPVQPDMDNTPDPGSYCFVTGNAPPGSGQRANEVQEGKTTLVSPSYDLSSLPNAWMRYSRWYSNDTGYFDPEEWAVDVSPDGGQSWVRIETDSKSNHNWQAIERNVGDFISLTSNVKFRFIVIDESYPTIVEAGVDDFSIVTYEDVPTSVTEHFPPAQKRAVLGRNAPNPFNPVTRITYSIPPGGETAPVSLHVYDVAGRLVRTLIDGPAPAGAGTAVWDGTDRNGKETASGIYFYRMEWNDQIETRRMVLLR